MADLMRWRRPGLRNVQRLATSSSWKWNPIHESLAEEIAYDDRLREENVCHRREQRFPPAFYSNPIVRAAAPEEVLVPYVVYIDGLPFNKVDSVLAIYAYSLLAAKRHLVASIRNGHLQMRMRRVVYDGPYFGDDALEHGGGI